MRAGDPCRVVSCRVVSSIQRRGRKRRDTCREERKRERERETGSSTAGKKIGVAIYIHRGVALEVTRKRVGSHAQFTSNKRARADLPVEERRDVVRIGICTATTSASPPRFTFPRQLLIRGSTHSLQVHLHRYTCNTAPHRALDFFSRGGCIVIHRSTRVGVSLSLSLSGTLARIKDIRRHRLMRLMCRWDSCIFTSVSSRVEKLGYMEINTYDGTWEYI